MTSGPLLTSSPSSPPINSRLAEARFWIPWIMAVSLFMTQLDATIVNTAVPTIAAAFRVPSLSLKAVLTSYTIALAVCIPLSGWLADRWGTRRVMLAAVGVFTAGSLCCGLAGSLPALVASRIFQGMGAALMMPVGRIAVLRTFEKSEIIRVMNFIVIPALIGPLLGPFLGGLIVHWLSWRMIFLVNLPFGCVGLALIQRYMPDAAVDPGRLDWGGFLLFGIGIALLSYVLEIFGVHGLNSAEVIILGCLALFFLAAYGRHALRIPNALMPLDLFNVRTFRISVVGGCVTRLGIAGMPFLLPLLYQLGLGYAPWQAGLLTMPQAAAAIGMKTLTQPILARLGYRRILLLNTLCIGLTIAAFSFVGVHTPLPLVVLLSLAQGSFSALQFTAMNTLAYADTTPAQASDASTMASTGQQLSISFGIACASLITGWFLGGIAQSDTGLLIPALHHAFITLGILTILSGATFLGLRANDGAAVSNHRSTEAEEA
ncbi:MAG: MFS transporter [Chthoniobacteraceae bacterium]